MFKMIKLKTRLDKIEIGSEKYIGIFQQLNLAGAQDDMLHYFDETLKKHDFLVNFTRYYRQSYMGINWSN